MEKKNLYILENINNKNNIRFFLAEYDSNVDFSKIDKYKAISYIGSGLIEETNEIPGGYYHCVDFDLSSIKQESIRNNIKDFIKSTFKDNIENENDFINLLKSLSDFFSKKKDSSNRKFIQNCFSLLLFINYSLDNKLIFNDFLINYYKDFDNLNEIQINDSFSIVIKYKKNLKIEYNPTNKLIDHISVVAKFNKNEKINIFEMINILKSKDLNTNNDTFIKLKEDLLTIDQEVINEICLNNLNDISFFYYDNIDEPIIEIQKINKCKQIYYKMEYSYSSFFDKNLFDEKVRSLTK